MSTRMTTFIKTKLKKSDDQANIDKYKVAAHITECHIISKLIFLRIIILTLIIGNLRLEKGVHMLTIQISLHI